MQQEASPQRRIFSAEILKEAEERLRVRASLSKARDLVSKTASTPQEAKAVQSERQETFDDVSRP